MESTPTRNNWLPFTPSLLSRLPLTTRPTRYTRADAIPHSGGTVTDYHSISGPPIPVRVPKKIATPIRVEGKVWFANERTWISWLNISVLVATLALALFNASEDNQVARTFAYTYAFISVGVLIYGYLLYQHRITMIRRRDPGHFNMILGPIIVSVLLFFAVFANFVIRVRELQRKHVPIPDTDDPNPNFNFPFNLPSLFSMNVNALPGVFGGGVN